MFGLDPADPHVVRERLARDDDRVVGLESEKAKEVLGPLDVTDHDRHVVEVFDHDPSSPRPYSPTAWHLTAWCWHRPP